MNKYTKLELANNKAQAVQRDIYRRYDDYCLEMETVWFNTMTGALRVRLPSDEVFLDSPWRWKHAGDFARILLLLSIEYNASPQNVHEFTFVASEFMRLAYDAEAMHVVSHGNRLKNFNTELGQQRVKDYAESRLESDPLCGWFIRPAPSSDFDYSAKIVRKLDVYGNRFIIKGTHDIKPARFSMDIVDLEELESHRFFETENALEESYGDRLGDVLF